MSPVLGIGIGLGYVTTENAGVGQEIFISVRNKDLKAQVSKLPLI
jgi:aminomethyltransferase